MITALFFALVVLVGVAAATVGFTSIRGVRELDRQDDREDAHRQLADRIAALELELGFREMTDDEVRRLDHAPPNAIVTEEYRQYATQKYTNRPLEP